MLKSLHIKSFRGLKDVRLEDLRRVNILVGENNSGKTSTLEAIMLAMAPGSSKNWFQVLQARDAAWNPLYFGEMAKWLFPVIDRDHLNEREPIEIETESDESQEKLRLVFDQSVSVVPVQKKSKGESENVDERLTKTTLAATWASNLVGEKAGQIVFEQVPSTQRFFPAVKIDSAIERIPEIKCVLVKPHAHRFGKLPSVSLSAAIKAGKKDVILRFLRAFDPDLDGIDNVQEGEDTIIFVQHSKLGPMPLHAFGDGLRKAVVVAGLVFEVARREADGGPKPGGLLLLDEAEVALHVSMQKDFFSALFELCSELEVQLVLTTHSLDAVDGILAGIDGDLESLAGFKLEPSGTERRVRRLSGDFIRELRLEGGMDIR